MLAARDVKVQFKEHSSRAFCVALHLDLCSDESNVMSSISWHPYTFDRIHVPTGTVAVAPASQTFDKKQVFDIG